jgi:HlyD family secretion protein
MARRIDWLGLTLFTLLVGCSREPAPSGIAAVAPTSTARGSIPVQVVNPKRQTIPWFVEQPGNVVAYELTPVLAKLPGYVAKVHVNIGDRVVGPTETAGGTLLAEWMQPENM